MIKRTSLFEIYRRCLAFPTLIMAYGRVVCENENLNDKIFGVESLLNGYERQRGVAKGFAIFADCSATLSRSGNSSIRRFLTIWNRQPYGMW